jgi:predicted DNA-binding WGR domain protein
MKKELIFSDEKSNKFWTIEVSGSSFTVTYGKIGTNGQSSTKDFDNNEVCQKEAATLIREKTKKGYQEAGESTGKASTASGKKTAEKGKSTTKGTQKDSAISGKSNSAKDALQKMLMPLCVSKEDEVILGKLCNKVTAVGADMVKFGSSEFRFTPGAVVTKRSDIPESFAEIGRMALSLTWDGGGPEVGYAISKTGKPRADGEGFSFLEDEGGEDCERINDAGGANPAFNYGQNWTFFDPTRTLKNGEPALAFISHEEVVWVEVNSADDLDYKQIFLRMISDAMIDSTYLPEMYC